MGEAQKSENKLEYGMGSVVKSHFALGNGNGCDSSNALHWLFNKPYNLYGRQRDFVYPTYLPRQEKKEELINDSLNCDRVSQFYGCSRQCGRPVQARCLMELGRNPLINALIQHTFKLNILFLEKFNIVHFD